MMKFSRSPGPFLGATLFIAALLILYHELRDYHYHEIVQSLRTIPDFHLIAALALTVANYIIMTGYDSLAFRYIKHPLSYRKISLASFVGYAFSNNMGLSMIAGSSVRYRLYSTWGLSAHEITKVVLFYTLTLWLGLFTIGSAVFLLKPLSIPVLLHIPFNTVFPLGIILFFLLLGYLLMITIRKKSISIRGWEFPIPSLKLSFFQIILSSLDWMLAGSVLYVLISQNGGISFPTFLGIYLLGQIAGLVSQVPGGLGVFETVLVVILSQKQPAPSLVAALLAYRIIYYLIPLGIAAILLGTHEALYKRKILKKVVHAFGSWGAELTPRILSLTTFLGGIILLFTGALPSAPYRLIWLKSFIPLPLMEISHFFGSLVGLGLLLLARGLQRRLDAVYINFRGIRDYKEKFDPIWHSKYMASPGGMVLPRIFVNIASLISGVMKGIVTK